MKKVTIALLAMMLATGANAQRKTSVSAKSKTTKTTIAKKKRGYSSDEGKKFNFSIGGSLAISNTVKTTLSDGSGTATITRSGGPAVGIFAYPKYNFYATEKFSLSIGIPLTIAFSGSASSRTGESSSSFLYDLPLMIDYNGGVMAPANRYGESRIGYFVGLGVGMENTDANYEYIGNGYTGTTPDYEKAKSVGPNIHAGGVIRIGSEERPRFIGIRLSYKIGLNSDKFNYFTPSIFLNY